MNTDLKKWNPFKFLRGQAREAEPGNSDGAPPNKQKRAYWPDIPRLFSREQWRVMEDFIHDPFSGRGVLDRWFGDFSPSRFRPRIDVVDEGQVLRVTVELPGLDREDLSVSVEDGMLVLRGEKKQDVRSEENGCYRLERAYGNFMRTIPMPADADPDHTLAKFSNGVLTLTVPKSESESAQSVGRTIEIN